MEIAMGWCRLRLPRGLTSPSRRAYPRSRAFRNGGLQGFGVSHNNSARRNRAENPDSFPSRNGLTGGRIRASGEGGGDEQAKIV